MILSRKLLRILAVRVVRSIILRVANDVPQAIHGLKRPRKYHKIEMFPGSSTVEHSAVNRRVASSNLARGANLKSRSQLDLCCFWFFASNHFWLPKLPN